MRLVRPPADHATDKPRRNGAACSPSVGVTRLREWLTGAALVALLVIPALRLVDAARLDILAIDFRQTFLPAAEALLDLSSPYPELGYPPLVAFLSVPFALTPVPEILAAFAVAACVPAALWLFGVRDWRCYAVAFLWVPVFNAVQTANVTLPILLAAAVAWRWRDRATPVSVATGLAIAAKFLAWPLLVWLASTRRLYAVVGSLLVTLVGTLGLWAVLGFSRLGSYGSKVEGAQGAYGDRGYTFEALALDAGLPGRVGLLASLACLAALLIGTVLLARAGDDERAFGCAAVAMVVATPLVWLHSFALLLAPVALLRPRLSAIWFLPALLWFASPDAGNGAPWQTVVTMATAAFVAVWVLFVPRGEGRLGQRVARRTTVTRSSA